MDGTHFLPASGEPSGAHALRGLIDLLLEAAEKHILGMDLPTLENSGLFQCPLLLPTGVSHIPFAYIDSFNIFT